MQRFRAAVPGMTHAQYLDETRRILRTYIMGGSLYSINAGDRARTAITADLEK